MADVYVNALTTISTEPTSTDSIVCVNRNTNEGQIIDYNLLADVILSKISSKTFSSLTTTSKLLTGAINELDADVTSLNSSAVRVSFLTTGTIEVPANGMIEQTINRTDSGTFLGATLSVSGSSYIIASVATFSSSSITVRLRNIYTSAVNPKIDIYLLYRN